LKRKREQLKDEVQKNEKVASEKAKATATLVACSEVWLFKFL
jgi:hypothetical protein